MAARRAPPAPPPGSSPTDYNYVVDSQWRDTAGFCRSALALIRILSWLSLGLAMTARGVLTTEHPAYRHNRRSKWQARASSDIGDRLGAATRLPVPARLLLCAALANVSQISAAAGRQRDLVQYNTSHSRDP